MNLWSCSPALFKRFCNFFPIILIVYPLLPIYAVIFSPSSHINLFLLFNTNITIKSGETKFKLLSSSKNNYYLNMLRMTISKPKPISVQNIVGIHQSGQCCPKNKPKNPTNPIITIDVTIISPMRSNVVIIC